MIQEGFIDKRIGCAQTCALLQATPHSIIPNDLDIEPSVFIYHQDHQVPVKVGVNNITTRTVVVPPKSVLCEIHPVTVEDIQPPTGKSGDVVGPSCSTDQSVPLPDGIEIDSETLSHAELQLGQNLISSYCDIFSKDDLDLGHSSAVKHRIELTNEVPFKQRCRRIPPSMFDEVKDHLHQLLACDVIRPSHSPWSSNVVLCRRKDGRLRMCTDFRELNLRTLKDSYALPRIEEILDNLGGNSFFSKLDMKSGYFQVEIAEEHKERTAFTVGPLGFYVYNCLPFCLCNSPATYQRLMEQCLGNLHLSICMVYIDDVVVFSKTLDEHLDRLGKVFQKIRDSNLKLAPKKCQFFKRKVSYVGHIVSEKGVEPDPGKVDAIQNWPTPSSPEEVRRFLGFSGYYRRFVHNFSQISRPLCDLLPNPIPKKKRKNTGAQVWKCRHICKLWI